MYDNEAKPRAVEIRKPPKPPKMDFVAAVEAIANMLYRGGMTSKSVGKPEALAARILAGFEVGLKPVQSCNFIMVVNGRASIWGDAAIGLVRASGELDAFFEAVEGEGDERVGVCRATRKGGETIEHRFSVADARLADLWGKTGPWTQYPQRMLTMRPRAWVLRDLFADVLCGLSIVEEQLDIPGDKSDVSVVTPDAPADSTSTAPGPVGGLVVEATPSPLVSVATIHAIGLARPAYLRGKGIDLDDSAAVQAAWRATLADYRVTSAKSLTEAEAGKLLAELRRRRRAGNKGGFYHGGIDRELAATVPPLGEWPGFLRPLVADFGDPVEAYAMGLDACGFPPTWATCYTDAAPFIERLKQLTQERKHARRN